MGIYLDKLNRVNPDRAFDIYKERFSNASGSTFVFVGNIDTISIKPLLEKYLGSLPAAYKNEQAKNLDIHIPEGKIDKTVYKGTEPRSTVMIVYSGKFDYSPENAVKMDALKETLQIRLLERLREDESGVYSPSISRSISKFPSPLWFFYTVRLRTKQCG